MYFVWKYLNKLLLLLLNLSLKHVARVLVCMLLKSKIFTRLCPEIEKLLAL